MSSFKRYQSKVFWNQMESQDLGGAGPPVTPTASPRRTRPRPFPASREHEEAFSLSREDSDATGPENTTVIRVDSPARSEAAALPALEERSFSPARSRGQRSQDSGFSDSERSGDSSDLGPESPRRSRRRRRSARHASGRAAARIQPEPAHTSTPKRESRQLERTHDEEAAACCLDYNPDDAASERLAPNASAETLGDFLYSSDPPDEEFPYADASRIEPPACPAVLVLRAPVRGWLEELRSDCEDECQATLQSKSLPRRRQRDDEPESRDLRLLAASATTAAKKLIDAAERLDQRYQRALDSIGNSKNRVDQDALAPIQAEFTEILTKLGSSLPRRVIQHDNPRNAVMQLTRLKQSVDRALDSRLDFYIEKVVRGLEEAPREGGIAARGALAGLTALGLAGPRAGASVARCSGIRALLTSLVSSGRLSSELRSSVLRALGSVCCCLEAVDQFVAEGGPEILAEVLAPGPGAPQTERSEAAALLVQITAPWMDRVGLPYVEPHAREFVQALTHLAETTTCKQTLLLAAAGINHLAHSRKCVAHILACDSIKKLLRCIKKSNDGNVWLMEQVAALVGQVSRLPEARAHLVESRASVALVCFLRMQPPGLEDEYRRLAGTAREALTRLCVDPEIARQVVAVGGSDCVPGLEAPGPSVQPAPSLQSTKSLRLARRIAAEQIGIARIHDSSPH